MRGSIERLSAENTYCQAHSRDALGIFRSSAPGKSTLPNPSATSCSCRRFTLPNAPATAPPSSLAPLSYARDRLWDRVRCADNVDRRLLRVSGDIRANAIHSRKEAAPSNDIARSIEKAPRAPPPVTIQPALSAAVSLATRRRRNRARAAGLLCTKTTEH